MAGAHDSMWKGEGKKEVAAGGRVSPELRGRIALVGPYRAAAGRWAVGVQTCTPVVDTRGRGQRRRGASGAEGRGRGGASEEEDESRSSQSRDPSCNIFLHI